MLDDAFAESLKSAACVEILFNCLAKSTQQQQIKGEKQLNDSHEPVQFVSDKFKKYEEDRAKNNKTIRNLNLGSQDFIE